MYVLCMCYISINAFFSVSVCMYVCMCVCVYTQVVPRK